MAETVGRVFNLLGFTGRTRSWDDSTLFERLLERHQDRLYRVAYRMTGNTDEAQDLLQDALIEAYKAFGNFKQGTYFDRWLYRIMTRTFIDSQRSKKRAKFLSLDAPTFVKDGDEASAGYEISDITNDPEQMMERTEYTEPLQKALDSLPPDFRLTIILADVEELSYEEIAQMMDCPIGTVRSRLHRARLQMKGQLERSGFVGGPRA